MDESPISRQYIDAKIAIFYAGNARSGDEDRHQPGSLGGRLRPIQYP